MYRIETIGGGHDYKEIVDNVDGIFVYAEDAMETIGNLKAELSRALETVEQFKTSTALQLMKAKIGRTIIDMSDSEYDRMIIALGRYWEWQDVVIHVGGRK
jgi:hypothetical protein